MFEVRYFYAIQFKDRKGYCSLHVIFSCVLGDTRLWTYIRNANNSGKKQSYNRKWVVKRNACKHMLPETTQTAMHKVSRNNFEVW
jgi:hypothetical protein